MKLTRPGKALPSRPVLMNLATPSGGSVTNYAKSTPLALNQSDNKGMSLLKKMLS